MKRADEADDLKPQQHRPETGRIRFEAIPGWMMPRELSREQPRSHVIGRGWRPRLLNAKP